MLDANVELGGGAFEWFVEMMANLFMPIIRSATNDYIQKENFRAQALIISGAYEDAQLKWRQEEAS